ncbi:MAG: DUF92 domain-containing protein [Candidatus Alcyoniella australis]|nr:DUF92 domain-containing protein [Candidatus Alcyoniella australis]
MDPFSPLNLLLGLGINGLIAAVSYRARAVDISGVIGGLLVGIAIWIGGGWQGYMLLLTFFIVGTAASRHKYALKAAKGIAQKKGGRRSAKHALANTSVTAIVGIAHLALPDAIWPLPCMAAGMAAALADTIASELGQLYGKHPISLNNFQRVSVGTEGAVSLAGTVLGGLGGALIAALAFVLGLVDGSGVLLVSLAALVAIHFESVLGGIFDIWHLDPNETLNFTQTAAAALIVYALI